MAGKFGNGLRKTHETTKRTEKQAEQDMMMLFHVVVYFAPCRSVTQEKLSVA